MAWRNGHGNGRGKVRLEQPADELPVGVSTARPVGFARDMSPAAQRERARKGGRSKAAWKAAIDPFESVIKNADPEIRAYLADAREAAKREMADVAKEVGGGVCSVAPSSMIMSGFVSYAIWLYCVAKGVKGTVDLGILSRCGKYQDQHRLSLTSARALAASEAKSRAADPGHNFGDLAHALSDGGYRAPPGAKVLTMHEEPPALDRVLSESNNTSGDTPDQEAQAGSGGDGECGRGGQS